jgi:hypothetical protein
MIMIMTRKIMIVAGRVKNFVRKIGVRKLCFAFYRPTTFHAIHPHKAEYTTVPTMLVNNAILPSPTQRPPPRPPGRVGGHEGGGVRSWGPGELCRELRRCDRRF